MRQAMPLWQKLSLLFTVLWVFVCGLSALTIHLTTEGGDQAKVSTPVTLALVVPPGVWLFAWAVAWWRRRAGRED